MALRSRWERANQYVMLFHLLFPRRKAKHMDQRDLKTDTDEGNTFKLTEFLVKTEYAPQNSRKCKPTTQVPSILWIIKEEIELKKQLAIHH